MPSTRTLSLSFLSALAALCALSCVQAASAFAQATVDASAAGAPPGAEPAPAPPPPPYSIPWQLRPAAAATVVRSDTAMAFYENPATGESGTTVASMLLGSYKITPE